MTNTQALIEAVDKADSADSMLEAVKALAAVRSEEAIPTLVEVLGYNNPGAAVAAVDGLIELGEVVVPYLLENVDYYNYGARAWAIRAFAGIGDPSTLDLLLAAATSDFAFSVRRAAARGLGTIRWSKMAAERVLAAQEETLKALLLASGDDEWVVRYGAVVGLESLFIAVGTTKADLGQQMLARFEQILENDKELAVRARVRLALQTIN